jgi:hypothetical protein
MAQDPLTYTPECISQLLERLRPFELSKGEVVMIINLRPASIAVLNTVVEDMAERFTDEQQEEIIGAIAEILGEAIPAVPAGEQGAGDVSMNDA